MPSADPLAEVAGAYAHQVDVSRRLATFSLIASGLAHHVLNPLTAISANAALMPSMLREVSDRSDGAVVSELAEMCEEVREAALRIHQIIRCMRRLSAAPVCEPRPTALARVVADALDQLEPTARAAVQVTVDVPDGLGVLATADGLTEATYQLLRNALEAIELSGGTSVWVEATVTTDGRVLLAVVDDGPGVRQGEVEHIFEPFFPAGRSPGHLGLGLATARLLIEGMGGRLLLEPREGGGAAFSMLLRRADGH